MEERWPWESEESLEAGDPLARIKEDILMRKGDIKAALRDAEQNAKSETAKPADLIWYGGLLARAGENEEADREPEELTDDDAAAGAAHVQARQRHRAHRDQSECDHQQRPVHVLQQAPVDPKH